MVVREEDEERVSRSQTTRTLRVTLRRRDVGVLRRMAYRQRRSPEDQAAWLLEQAIRAYEDPEEGGDGCEA